MATATSGTDVFGYENTVKSNGQIASSEFAIISMGSGAAEQALVQSISSDYSQQIDTVLSVGDSNIYWVPGRPLGSINISKLVGAGGFFSGWRGTECGRIDNMSVNVDDGRCGFNGKGNLTFNGGIVERLSVTLGNTQRTIAETATIRVAFIGAK